MLEKVSVCKFWYFVFLLITDLNFDNSGGPDCSENATAISPLVSTTNLLQQTEDQITSSLDGPFVNLLPPLLHEDYLLGLDEEEGISDLFDAYDFEKVPALMDGFLCSWFLFLFSF